MASVCSAAALSKVTAPAAAFMAAALATVSAAVSVLSCSSLRSAMMLAMTSTVCFESSSCNAWVVAAAAASTAAALATACAAMAPVSSCVVFSSILTGCHKA